MVHDRAGERPAADGAVDEDLEVAGRLGPRLGFRLPVDSKSPFGGEGIQVLAASARPRTDRLPLDLFLGLPGWRSGFGPLAGKREQQGKKKRNRDGWQNENDTWIGWTPQDFPADPKGRRKGRKTRYSKR